MIEQITVRNFKSIRSVTVNLEPVTVLIGRSGTGKSNFLGAIAFLRDYLLSGDNAVNAAGGWDRLCPATEPASAFSIDLRFRLEGYESPFFYSIKFLRESPRHSAGLANEELCLGDVPMFRRTHQRWQDQPPVVGLPSLGNSPALGKLPTLSEAVLAFTTLTTGIGMYDFQSSVLESNGKADLREGLSDNASNFLRVLQALTRDLRDQRARRSLLARLQQLNPTVRAVELDDISAPTRAVVAHEFDGKRLGLNLSQESDGFRRFYAHLLALYQTPPKPLLMFEEPENGIYPGAMAILAEEFKAAPPAGRGQVLLTTHSPTLLNYFDPASFRVTELDPKTQETRIAPLSKEQRASLEEQLLEPGELLTTDEARTDASSVRGAAGA
ncbi:MAG: AAA family ATPase [Phycisphaerales bacterium]|nr:AAA family ATPase [Phycisphaerales bacterium]